MSKFFTVAVVVSALTVCANAQEAKPKTAASRDAARPAVVLAFLPADRSGTAVTVTPQPHTGSGENVTLGTRLVVEDENETAYKVVTPNGYHGWIAKLYATPSKEPRLDSVKALVRQLTDDERKTVLQWLQGEVSGGEAKPIKK